MLHKPINIKVKVFKGFELHFATISRLIGMRDKLPIHLFNSLFSIQILPTQLLPFFFL